MNELFVEGDNLPLPLTIQETKELLKYAQQGDLKSRNKIIEHNIRLVLFVVNKFSVEEEIKQDLVSVGLIGLIKAIDTFNLNKNISLTTYSTVCIRNEILMFFRKNNKKYQVESLYKDISVDGETANIKIIDILSDQTDIIEEYAEKDSIRILKEIIDKLPKRDRTIIEMNFGFNGSKRYSQSEIAKKVGLHQSYISRRIKTIICNIKKDLIEQGIIEEEYQLKKTKKPPISKSKKN